MKKTPFLLFILLFIRMIFVFSQNSPSFLEDTFQIPHMLKQQTIFIPQIDDGDGGVQDITIMDALSEHDSIVVVDSFAYDNQYNMGVIYVTANRYYGGSKITINIQDNGTVPNTFLGTITVQVQDFFTDDYKGANFQHFEKGWDVGSSIYGTYRVIDSTYSPDAFIDKDIFYQGIWGYLRPPRSGNYSFIFEGNEGGYINLDGIEDLDPEYLVYYDEGLEDSVCTDTLAGGKCPCFLQGIRA